MLFKQRIRLTGLHARQYVTVAGSARGLSLSPFSLFSRFSDFCCWLHYSYRYTQLNIFLILRFVAIFNFPLSLDNFNTEFLARKKEIQLSSFVDGKWKEHLNGFLTSAWHLVLYIFAVVMSCFRLEYPISRIMFTWLLQLKKNFSNQNQLGQVQMKSKSNPNNKNGQLLIKK